MDLHHTHTKYRNRTYIAFPYAFTSLINAISKIRNRTELALCYRNYKYIFILGYYVSITQIIGLEPIHSHIAVTDFLVNSSLTKLGLYLQNTACYGMHIRKYAWLDSTTLGEQKMSLFKGIDTEDSNSNYPLIYGIALPIFTPRVEATFFAAS